MSTQPDAEIQALLDDLWKRHLPSLVERISILEQAAAEATSGSLPEPMRAEAQSVAHKLAGNLGMFGHPGAGEIASRIEQILKSPAPDTITALAPLAAHLRDLLAPHLALPTDN
jgi:HPt (histidine-containing phosphotransfer) domain-containing protein